MKKILIIVLALIFSSSAFAQKKSRALRKMDEKIDAMYHSDAFRLSYLVIPPSIYNPNNDTTISFIEFFQDTTAQYKVKVKTSASIDPGQSKKENYIIGYVGLFQATDYTVNVIIRRVYKSGKESKETATIHFDDLIVPTDSMESATYGTEGVIFQSKKDKLVGM